MTTLYEAYGGATYPVYATQIDSAALSFEALDPCNQVLLDLVTAALRAELGTGASSAWGTVCAALPSGHSLSDSTNPVGSQTKLPPNPEWFRQVKRGTFPIVSVYCEPSVTYVGDLEKDHRLREWKVVWILGPGEAGENRKLEPVLPWFSGLMRRVILHARHPAYASGVDVLALAQLSSWATGGDEAKHQWGVSAFGERSPEVYLACQCPVLTQEQAREIEGEGGQLVFGTDITVGVGGDEGILPAFVVAQSELPVGE